MTVINEEVEVRVRPPRIAVVISSHTTHIEYIRVIELLSLFRGGKYARLIYADMKTLDFVSFFEHEMRGFQPEIIIGAGEQEKFLLRNHVLENARPQIIQLCGDIQKNFDELQKENLLPWQGVIKSELKHHPNLKRDNLYLLNWTASSDFEPLVATLYGKLSKDFSENIHNTLQTGKKNVSVTNATELFELNRFMVSRVSWLDFLNQNLDLIYASFNPPKVIVVSEQEPFRGLALYWNISRQYPLSTRNESLLLFREQDIENREALSALAQTISRTTINSNYCEVITAEEDINFCTKTARSLRARLQKGKKKTYHVDAHRSVVAPHLQCYENKANSTISRTGNIVTIPRIEPLYKSHPGSVKWYLDLVKAKKTNRYPFEFCLPKDVDILDLLNLPSGQFFAFRRLISFSEECLSISFTSSDRNSTVRFELPSERELFEVIFQRGQWRLQSDEKNTRYTRALALFSRLTDAAIALSGTSWRIIDALRSDPLTEDSLRGKAKLGKRSKSIPLPEIAEWVRNRQYGLYGTLFERRVKRELADTISDVTPVEHILEYLLKRNVLFRKWKLDQCPGCKREYWETDLDVRKPFLCPGCQTYIPFKDRVRLGYELNRLMQLALDEGMRPVILTARFLRNLTWHGFIMYPGAKLRKSTQETDLDLCAIGDGILIAGECKTLEDYKESGRILWRRIVSNLELPIEAAKACRFQVFFVASLAERYPKSFKDEVVQIAGDSLKLLFLNRKDLETGRRKYTNKEGHEHTLSLQHLFKPKPFRNPKGKGKIRTIGF